MKTSVINLRVEPKLKRRAEKVLHPLGLTTTDAITIFLHKLVMEEGLPFEVKIPNKATQKAMKDALAGKNSKRYKSVEDLRREFE
jgi:DNA-damage-inducible protein J